MEEYHPAYGHPPEHDHHRRARHLLVAGLCAIAFGSVSLYWASGGFWGETQQDIARVAGWIVGGLGIGLVVIGAVAWFAVDDDQHPDPPDAD